MRLWRATARAEVLGPAVRATDRSYPAVHAAAIAAAGALHVALVPVSVSPGLPVAAGVFGTDEEPQLLVHAGLAEAFVSPGAAPTAPPPPELVFVMGMLLGHVQNRHVLLLTAYRFLDRLRGALFRMAAAPARTALGAFARRAQVTADRAGLIAGRSLPAARVALGRLESLDQEIAAVTGSAGGAGALPSTVRARALEVFAAGAYFRGVAPEAATSGPATSARETDRAVAAVLKAGAPEPAHPNSDADDEDDAPAPGNGGGGPAGGGGERGTR